MKTILRISQYLMRYRWLFYLTLVLALGSTLFWISVPKAIRWVFNGVIATGQIEKIWVGVGIILFCYAMREILNSLRIRVNNTLEQRVLIDLRTDLHRKLMALPISFYDTRKSGEISSRVIEDVQNVERALLDGTEQGLSAIFTIVGIMVMLFLSEPQLAWMVVAPLPVVLLLNIWHARATRRNWKKVREASGQLNSLLIEDIQGNRLIHSFALQEREYGRFKELAQLVRERTLVAMFRWSRHGPGSSFISSLGMVAVAGYGGYLIETNPAAFSLGQLLEFFLYAGMLYEPLSRMNGLNHMFAAAVPSGRRVFDILDYPVSIQNAENPQPFPKKTPLEIRFEDVYFSYLQRDQVIDGLNLTLRAGEMTALVGHTGAGKSTIANLIPRYYDTDMGSVKIEGVDVRDIELSELRQHIGHVAQDPFLFDGSVRDNLRLARGDATEAGMIEALKGARAWDFVSCLPQGMDTQIGEKGIRLSMGEKQRLTIARVLLKNPPIVILDEATSSVDTLTERYIQEALEILMQNRTVLVIAHRLSTVRKANKIVVLEKGKIVESGTHDELLEQAGHYARLWTYQHDFIPEG